MKPWRAVRSLGVGHCPFPASGGRAFTPSPLRSQVPSTNMAAPTSAALGRPRCLLGIPALRHRRGRRGAGGGGPRAERWRAASRQVLGGPGRARAHARCAGFQALRVRSREGREQEAGLPFEARRGLDSAAGGEGGQRGLRPPAPHVRCGRSAVGTVAGPQASPRRRGTGTVRAVPRPHGVEWLSGVGAGAPLVGSPVFGRLLVGVKCRNEAALVPWFLGACVCARWVIPD